MSAAEGNKMEELDLWGLLNALLRRAWAIILLAVIGAGLAFGYTYFMVDPLYKASALLYVNNSKITMGSTGVSISASELSTAQRLVDTYIVILKSRNVLNDVIERGELDVSYEALRGMISAEAVNSTEVFEVVVTSKSPHQAEHIANTIAEVLPDKITDIVAGSDVRIVDYAVVPGGRSSPSYTRNAMVGALLGAVLCIAVLVLLYMLDDKIHSEEYLTQNYPDIPLLSVIPDMDPDTRHAGGYYGYRSRYGYHYRSYSRDSQKKKKKG